MSEARSQVAAELARYRDLLQPLEAIPASGGDNNLPAEERRALEQGIATVRGYHGDHLELEEAVAAFARALWAAPSAGEPRAWVALALMARARHWIDPQRGELSSLARNFAQKAFAIQPGLVAARIAWARALLLAGDVAEGERIAAFLPEDDALALALRSEIAESRGDLERAIALRKQELELHGDPLSFRAARNKLGLLLQAAGRLDEAVAVHQANLTRYPDYAWGHVNLAAALEARNELGDAFAEVESAIVLGLDEAAPYLEELAGQLDRRSLERFHRLLLAGRDGETVDLTPLPAGAR